MTIISPIKLVQFINKYIDKTFNNDGKMPGTLAAQARVKQGIMEFFKDNGVGGDITITITSPNDPFTAEIETVVRGENNLKHTHRVELKDILQKEEEITYVPVMEKVQEFTNAKIITPVTDVAEEPEIIEEVPVTKVKEVEVETQTPISKPVEEEDIEYPNLHELVGNISNITSLGAFINAVNLFNIGNIQLGTSIQMSQITNINGTVWDIMKNYNNIKDYFPNSICEIEGVMDYKRNMFSLMVNIDIDCKIQKFTSRYHVHFFISSK